MITLELELPKKDLKEFKRICAKAGVEPDQIIKTFVSAVNEYYAGKPELLREFSPEKFFPKPIAETIYRFNPKSEKIERIGLTDRGRVLKLEEATPMQIKEEVKSMQAALREYFKYLEDFY